MKLWAPTFRQPPDPKNLHQKIVDRIEFFERELRNEYGMYVVSGAELEFATLTHDNERYEGDLPYTYAINRLKEHVPLLETLYTDNRSVREALVGTVSVLDPRDDESQHLYAASAIVESLTTIKQKLPAILLPALKAVFDEPELVAPQTTALHLNTSVYDKEGNNMFFTEDGIPYYYSTLGRLYGTELRNIQSDALALYAPNESSYLRFDKGAFTPHHFKITKLKNSPANSSVAFRNSTEKHSHDSPVDVLTQPDLTRVEDRLAGSDADPAMVMLANIGALYYTIKHHTRATPYPTGKQERIELETPSGKKTLYLDSSHINLNSEASIMQDLSPMQRLQKAKRDFVRSDVMREICGNELHELLVHHQRSNTRSNVAAVQ